MPDIHTKIKYWLGCGGILCQTDCTSMFQTRCALLFPQQLNAPHQTQDFPLFYLTGIQRAESPVQQRSEGMGRDGTVDGARRNDRKMKKRQRQIRKEERRGRKSEPRDRGGSVTAILTLFLYRYMSKAGRENNNLGFYI